MGLGYQPVIHRGNKRKIEHSAGIWTSYTLPHDSLKVALNSVEEAAFKDETHWFRREI